MTCGGSTPQRPGSGGCRGAEPPSASRAPETRAVTGPRSWGPQTAAVPAGRAGPFGVHFGACPTGAAGGGGELGRGLGPGTPSQALPGVRAVSPRTASRALRHVPANHSKVGVASRDPEPGLTAQPRGSGATLRVRTRQPGTGGGEGAWHHQTPPRAYSTRSHAPSRKPEARRRGEAAGRGTADGWGWGVSPRGHAPAATSPASPPRPPEPGSAARGGAGGRAGAAGRSVRTGRRGRVEAGAGAGAGAGPGRRRRTGPDPRARRPAGAQVRVRARAGPGPEAGCAGREVRARLGGPGTRPSGGCLGLRRRRRSRTWRGGAGRFGEAPIRGAQDPEPFGGTRRPRAEVGVQLAPPRASPCSSSYT